MLASQISNMFSSRHVCQSEFSGDGPFESDIPSDIFSSSGSEDESGETGDTKEEYVAMRKDAS